MLAEEVASPELGAPDDCPPGDTAQVVRTIWNGGVDGANGVELDPTDEAQLAKFSVIVDAGGGVEQSVIPIGFGDLNDGDNNVDLCVADVRPMLRVEVAAVAVTDPLNDWNDYTEAVVQPE